MNRWDRLSSSPQNAFEVLADITKLGELNPEYLLNWRTMLQHRGVIPNFSEGTFQD